MGRKEQEPSLTEIRRLSFTGRMVSILRETKVVCIVMETWTKAICYEW